MVVYAPAAFFIGAVVFERFQCDYTRLFWGCFLVVQLNTGSPGEQVCMGASTLRAHLFSIFSYLRSRSDKIDGVLRVQVIGVGFQGCVEVFQRSAPVS
jgi:hypothetical protein